MIQADFCEWYSKEGKSLELKVDGHANYDSHGRDIVCAGVSAITQALVGFIENGDCEGECQESDCGGYVEIYVFKPTKEVEAAFEMAFIGLLQIEMAHPNFVTVTKKASKKL